MRRSRLTKVVNVAKRYLIAAAAHNLGRILFKLFGIGKPRALQGEGGRSTLAQSLYFIVVSVIRGWQSLVAMFVFYPRVVAPARP